MFFNIEADSSIQKVPDRVPTPPSFLVSPGLVPRAGEELLLREERSRAVLFILIGERFVLTGFLFILGVVTVDRDAFVLEQLVVLLDEPVTEITNTN
jgi:hypothetical protein